MLARSSSRGSNPADVRPRAERTRPRGAVLAGGDVVAAEMEKVVDLVVGGEETLRLAGRLEALHLAFSSSRRLVRVLGSVVEWTSSWGVEGSLSVHPGSCSFLTELSDHEPNGGPAQERQAVAVQTLPILGETATAVEPGDGPLDDPPLGQHDELRGLGSLDDLDVDLAADPLQSLLKLRALVAAVGVELQQKREQAEQRAHQQHATVAVLDVGRVEDGVQQQALGVYQDMALLALDLLARIKAGRVDRDPPFSALLTLWLSMIAAVGLASRSANSRHCTYSA